MKYKINPKSSIFYDPVTGIMITKGEEVEITQAQVSTSIRIKDAIRGKHIIPVVEEKEPEKPLDEDKGDDFDQERYDELYSKTVKEILKEFDYMSEEDLKEANSKKNKDQMVRFLMEADNNYE